MKPDPGSRSGVEVYSWGTETPGTRTGFFKGTASLLRKGIQGGNIGHVALKLTMPYSEENLALVQSTLGHGNQIPCIPWEVQTYSTPTVHFDESSQTMKVDKENPAYQEKVIEVYFSWWPDDKHGFSFMTFEDDTYLERAGLPVTYNPKWAEYLKPAQERETESLSSYFRNKVYNLHSLSVLHESGHSEEELKFLHLYQRECSCVLILAPLICSWQNSRHIKKSIKPAWFSMPKTLT